ncbi:hypothetical protein [Rubritalea tangerina]|uniref:alpha-2-macroglobulin family protein n=1 Tax=Rubritalea tangerina TaxID=430798 RepID=UPI00361D18D0
MSDKVENTFTVAYPRPLLSQSRFHRLNAQSPTTNLVANMNPIIMNGRGHMELEFSNSLLLEASGAYDYLLKYPYGCVEQTTSSLMPWFAVNDLKGIIPSFAEKSDAEVAKALQKGVDRLLSMQTPSGGLAYWPGGQTPEDWATVYGGMGIVLALQQGAEAPEDSIEKLAQYLTKIANGTTKEPKYRSWHTDTRARALYVLALAGNPNVAAQNAFYTKRNSLTNSARAFLALAMHLSGDDKKFAIELLTNDGAQPDRNHWMLYRSDIPVQLLAWSTIDPTNAETDKTMLKLLQYRNPMGHWRTTWVNGWAMNAMAAYGRFVEAKRPNSTITLATTQGNQTITLTNKQPSKSLRLPLAEAQTLMANADEKVYIRAKASAKPEVAPSGPVAANGLSIQRKYERINAKGQTIPLEQPQVGDLIKVSLTVGMPAGMRYIAIDDALPSILESVNDQFASQASIHSSKIQKNYRISNQEFRAERTLFFLNRSWGSQKQTISYLLESLQQDGSRSTSKS